MRTGHTPGGPEHTTILRGGEPTGERVRLTMHDQVNGVFMVPLTFYYRQTLDADALRESLRRTLAQYPLLTGRLKRDRDRGVSVACDDAGAIFTVARSGRPMPDYGPELSARPDIGGYLHPVSALRVVGHDTPLFTAKVTHMHGGGSVLGISINHTVLDLSAYFDFLLHWGQVHAGRNRPAKPHDRTPFDRLAGEATAAPDDPQYAVVSARQLIGFIWRVNTRARTLSTVSVRFPAQQVLDLKEAARAEQDPGVSPVSSGDALSAHLWRVLASLRSRQPEAHERLGIVVGLRAALTGRLPHGYGGNAVSNTTAVLLARELRDRPFAHTASVVRAALDRVTLNRVRAEAAFLAAQRTARRPNRVLSRMSLDAFEGTVAVNNVSGLPHYAVEFGAGRPFWVEAPASPIPWTVSITSTPDDDHSRDVTLSVPRDVAEALTGPRGSARLHAPAGR